MPAYKDKAKGTWYASFYFENWTGKKEKKMKRGFKTKREALEWERTFLQQQTADLDMTFESFVALYAADMKGRIKENTYITRRLLDRAVVVQGNPRVYKALRDQLAAVLGELRRIEAGGDVGDELLATIDLISVTLGGMKED